MALLPDCGDWLVIRWDAAADDIAERRSECRDGRILMMFGRADEGDIVVTGIHRDGLY